MNAVWHAAWAAVRRRKLQTIVIGVVVCAASATLVMARRSVGCVVSQKSSVSSMGTRRVRFT